MLDHHHYTRGKKQALDIKKHAAHYKDDYLKNTYAELGTFPDGYVVL